MLIIWASQQTGSPAPPGFQPSLDFSDERNSQYLVFFALLFGFKGT